MRAPADGSIEEFSSPAILLAPAMGVPSSHYRPFVEQHGYTVTVADLESVGHHDRSRPKAGFAGLVEERICQGFDVAAAARPRGRVVLVGHSLGGQLGLVFAGRFAPDTPVELVASGSAYFAGFEGLRRWAYLIGSQAIAGAATLLGWWPGGRLGFGGRQTARTMQDWTRNVRTRRYASRDSSFDYDAALRSFQDPLAVFDIEGDVLAPISATTRLITRTGALVSRRDSYLPQRGTHRPGAHFTWARDVPGVVPQIHQRLSQEATDCSRSGEGKE